MILSAREREILDRLATGRRLGSDGSYAARAMARARVRNGLATTYELVYQWGLRRAEKHTVPRGSKSVTHP